MSRPSRTLSGMFQYQKQRSSAYKIKNQQSVPTHAKKRLPADLQQAIDNYTGPITKAKARKKPKGTKL